MKFRSQLVFITVKILSLFARHKIAISASGDSTLQKEIIEVNDGKYSEPNKDLKLLNNAIKQKSKLAEANLEPGNSKRRIGKDREVIEDFDRAILENPKLANAYIERGNTKRGLKQYSSAIEDYNRAIRLDPKNHQALLDRGRAFYHLKNYSASLTDFNAVNNISSNDYWFYYWRGAAYIQLDNIHFQQAILDLDRAVFLWKSSTNKENLLVGYSLYSMRGAAKICALQLPAALTDFKQALKLAQKEGNLERIESAKQTIEQLERYLTLAVFSMTILLLIFIVYWNKIIILHRKNQSENKVISP
jgi:tetratricopeptide (TPR) repeat protein